jgi:hypothetical protein
MILIGRQVRKCLAVGTVGDSCDNALAECVIGLFKTEVINQIGRWKSMREFEWETLKWVDWYNKRRLLGPIGDIPPAEVGGDHAGFHDLDPDAQGFQFIGQGVGKALHPEACAMIQTAKRNSHAPPIEEMSTITPLPCARIVW